MRSYTVHEPPEPPAERLDRAERIVFVKDGFSLSAALFGPLWILANGLWLALLGYLVVAVLLSISLEAAGAPDHIKSIVFLGLNLLVGFEADALKRWTMDRRGWTQLGSVMGETRNVCERRFFEAWLPSVPAVDPAAFSGFKTDPVGDTGVTLKDGDPGYEISRPVPKSWSVTSPWRRGKTE